MPNLDVEIEVWCSCGHGLCGQTVTGTNRSLPTVTVEPCTRCLDKAWEQGKNEGYDEAKKEEEKK